jgi:hypothetical protein
MTVVLVLCAFVVVGWFAAGTIWNVRKGSAVMKWMHDGLPLIGERTTVRWLGSTTVELGIEKAKPPFEKVTVVVVLEPRDVPWMWALTRGRGRRDTLIVRGVLQGAPPADLEVLDPKGWLGREAARRLDPAEWHVRPSAEPGGLAVYSKTSGGPALADALLDLAGREGIALRRLSLRRGGRTLELHAELPSAATRAPGYFEGVRALGERAAR